MLGESKSTYLWCKMTTEATEAALEHPELERQRLQQELDEANHVIEATATRTLQRAFGQRWAAVLKADPEALKEERAARFGKKKKRGKKGRA